MYCLHFFFFKQKTAYELRISDWSSDVCSSDLLSGQRQQATIAAECECHPLRAASESPFNRCVTISGTAQVSELAFVRHKPVRLGEIGRASCRERVCQYV